MAKLKTREQIENEIAKSEREETMIKPQKELLKKSEWLTEEEWKETLKNHNMPYYPMNQELNAEATYYEARKWFENKPQKPNFCKVSPRVAKLEKEYDGLMDMLLKFDLPKEAYDSIEDRLRDIRRKLKVR